MPPRARGRGRGGRGQNTNPPQLVPPAATPIPTTSTPPPAAGCAADALHRPSRDRQPPVKFRDGGSDGETSDIQNVSGDKGGGGDPTPGIHALPSPLRTAIGTPQSDPLLTDPLLTGSGTTQSRDVHDLTHVSNDRRICKFCEDTHKSDPSHHIISYALTTGTANIRKHFTLKHARLYLEELILNQWEVSFVPLNKLQERGWSLQDLLEKVKQDPACNILSLGPHPDAGVVLPGTRVSASGNTLPEFSVTGMHRLIMRFVAVDDQAINVVESEQFRDLIRFLRRDIKESDIPHRTKLRELILQAWTDDFKVLKGELAKAQGKISFTSDLWSDDVSKVPYLAITAHWISLDDRTSKLVLRTALIAFNHMPGSHTGHALGSRMLYLLDRAEVVHNIGHFTLDNASNNNTALQELATLLDQRGIYFDPVDHRIPCFPHIVNICIKHIIDEFTGADFSRVADSWVVGKRTIHKDAYVAALKNNPIKRARAAVSAIRITPLRRENFRKIITNGNDRKWFRDENKAVQNLPMLEPLCDVETRWDSTYLMLYRLRTLRPAVDRFFTDPEQGALGTRALTSADWDVLLDMETMLEIGRLAQQRMSGESTPLLSGAVPIFQELIAGWKRLQEVPHLMPIVTIGLAWASEYTDRMDKTKAYAIAMFVDPAIRLSRMNEFWGDEGARDISKSIIDLMVEVEATIDEDASDPTLSPPTEAPELCATTQTLGSRLYGIPPPNMQMPGGGPDHVRTIEQEFNSYATAKLSAWGTDKLEFWKVSKSTFPIIYVIAMDYLPVQASAVPCERVFSSSSETCTKKRNRISPILVEALQMVKFSVKKERLNFTKGWASLEKDLVNTGLYDAESTIPLASVTDGATDTLLRAVAEQEGDDIPNVV